jgi:hypothetical protein
MIGVVTKMAALILKVGHVVVQAGHVFNTLTE